jgi:hypothetical protein
VDEIAHRSTDNADSSEKNLAAAIDWLSENGNLFLLNAQTLSSLKELIEKLPPDKEVSSFKSLASELETRIGSLRDSQNELMSRVKQRKGLMSADFMNAFWKQTDSIESQREGFRTLLEVLSSDALKKSVVTRLAEKKHLRVYRWASYFLYFIGWAMALVGRLFGVDSLVGAE